MGVGQYETNTDMVVFSVEDDGARIVVVDPPVATKVPEPVYIVSGRRDQNGLHTNVPQPEKLPLPDTMPDDTIDDSPIPIAGQTVPVPVSVPVPDPEPPVSI